MRLLRHALHLLLSLARELSDENGYQRHLLQSHQTHTAEAWRHYIDRKQARKYKNPKCC